MGVIQRPYRLAMGDNQSLWMACNSYVGIGLLVGIDSIFFLHLVAEPFMQLAIET